VAVAWGMHSTSRAAFISEQATLQVSIRYPEPIVAAGLSATLCSARDLEVLVEEFDPGEAVHSSAHVVLTDAMHGMVLARRRRQHGARTKILLVLPNIREHELRLALDLGVDGCVSLGCSIRELHVAVRTLARGGRYLCEEAVACMADSLGREPLTTRERDVLELLVRGCRNKTIANALGLRVSTIKVHVRAIMSKLDAATRTEVVSFSTRLGLVTAPEVIAREAAPGARTPS
jgi:DNA-binding NarL/FixJ family response regulator